MGHTDFKGYYATLRLAVGASMEDVKRAFRRLAKEWHPDRNPDANAARKFRQLTEAYDVLSNPETRAEYDSACLEENQAETVHLDVICCSQCQKPTAQPRYLVFWRVISVLVGSWRSPRQGVFCAACARQTAITSNIVTGIFGWWGLWGFFWTLKALVANAKGGDRPPETEDHLLWHNALAFFSKGQTNLARSLASMVASRHSEYTAAAKELLEEFDRRAPGSERPLKLADPWTRTFGDMAAHAAAALTVPIIVFFLMSNGQEASSASPFGASTPYTNYDTAAADTAADAAAASPVWSTAANTTAADAAADASAAAQAPSCGRQLADGEILQGDRVSTGNVLEIDNGSEGPAIIKVRNANTGRVQLAFFVNQGNTASVKLPDGEYRVQYAFGDALAEDCRSFNQINSAGEFPDTETLQTEYSGDRVSHAKLSYTLYTVPGGNVHPQSIDPATFDTP